MNNFDSINAEFRRAIDLMADGIDCEGLDRFLGELILGLTRLLNLPFAVLWLHDVPAGNTKARAGRCSLDAKLGADKKEKIK